MKDNTILPILAVTAASAVIYGLLTMNKDNFSGEIREFKSFNYKYRPDDHLLAIPPVKEEIGLAQVYPQGSGVAMSSENSKGLPPDLKLDDHNYPEAYGQSSLGNRKMQFTDGMKILSVKTTGKQDNYSGLYFNDDYLNVSDGPEFQIEQLMQVETIPGKQFNNNDIPEQSYPATLQYKNNFIIDGDIPYGETVNGKINPRLLSRWEYYTNQYNAKEKLSQSGLLYPKV